MALNSNVKFVCTVCFRELTWKEDKLHLNHSFVMFHLSSLGKTY